eukprot:1155506-Pelagomonas_calceolata.AAC.6
MALCGVEAACSVGSCWRSGASGQVDHTTCGMHGANIALKLESSMRHSMISSRAFTYMFSMRHSMISSRAFTYMFSMQHSMISSQAFTPQACSTA